MQSGNLPQSPNPSKDHLITTLDIGLQCLELTCHDFPHHQGEHPQNVVNAGEASMIFFKFFKTCSNCDASINRRAEFPITREWKKCPSEKRENFKTQLLNYLRFVMRRETNANRQIQTRTLNSFEDEKVANWHFEKLDQNHNGVC